MNIIIASDIHGSVSDCTKFIKACYLEQAETVLLLGDILDGNKEVAELLNALNRDKGIFCVRGNCDYPEDQAMLDFPIMAEYCLLFVRDKVIFATHGHRALPNISPERSILLHGHTHAPAWASFLDLCPGSVSKPRRNSQRGYMLLNDSAFSWKDLNDSAFSWKDLDGRTYHELRF